MDDEPNNLEQLRRLTKRLANSRGKEKTRLELKLVSLQKEIDYQNRMAQIFLTHPGDEMYGEVLDVVLEAMESKHGAFGYLDQDENWVCPSLTRSIWGECKVEDKNIVFPKSLWKTGTWGKVYTTKASLLLNEPVSVPDGHLAIARLLIVPLRQKNQLIGMIAVANKKMPYTDADKGLLERLAAYITPILHLRVVAMDS